MSLSKECDGQIGRLLNLQVPKTTAAAKADAKGAKAPGGDAKVSDARMAMKKRQRLSKAPKTKEVRITDRCGYCCFTKLLPLQNDSLGESVRRLVAHGVLLLRRAECSLGRSQGAAPTAWGRSGSQGLDGLEEKLSPTGEGVSEFCVRNSILNDPAARERRTRLAQARSTTSR